MVRYPEVRSILFDKIAWATLLIKDENLLWQADDCSRLALDGTPWLADVKSTRGSVLVELGRLDEAIPLLQDALKAHPEDDGRAIAAWQLGLAFARKGAREESGSYFALARKLDPHCVFLGKDLSAL